MNPSTKSPRPAVAVPHWVLAALVTAVLVSVVAVAFFAGRESGRGPQPVPTTMVTSATAVAPAASLPPIPTAETPAPTLPAMEFPPPATAPPASVGEAWPSTAPPMAAPRDTLRDAVATYFREVETIQSQGGSSSDPEAFARALLEQGANGDMSGFDALARGNQKVRDGLGAVAVPEPCREHHRQTVALIEESIAMLERVKDKIRSGDASSLAALPAEGYALERKAKDVDALAVEIKRRFSL